MTLPTIEEVQDKDKIITLEEENLILKQGMDSLNSRIDELENNLERSIFDKEEYWGDCEELKEETTALEKELDSKEEQIEYLHKTIVSLHDKLEAIEEPPSGPTERLKGNTFDYAGMEARILLHGFDGFQKKIEDRLDTMAEQVEGLDEDVGMLVNDKGRKSPYQSLIFDRIDALNRRINQLEEDNNA